jgi:SAM-dependent methyltransferase
MSRTQEALVAAQFDPQADAYVSSAVHLSGCDLDELERLIAGRGLREALDLGCGGGHVSYRLAPHVRQVIAYDLSSTMLQAVTATAREKDLANIETRQGAAERLPFRDGSFDLVASRFSAHHWTDLRAGLREAHRVLRSGGVAAFMDIVSPAAPVLDTFLQAVEVLRDPSHVRDYASAEWVAAVGGVGFRIERTMAYRLRLEFASWIGRMRTPPSQAEAIRALQNGIADQVRHYFEVADDGSFSVDALVIFAKRS